MSTYWEKMGDSFALPFCVKCAQFHFYPKPACPHCGSTDVSQSEVSGYGEVYSFSIVYRSPSPAFNDEVPYVIAIVATREGPHLMTRLVDVPACSISTALEEAICRTSIYYRTGQTRVY